MNNDYSIGEYVMYKSGAICRIADIRHESFGGEEREYYLLEGASDKSSRVFVPVDGEERMRPLLTKAEIDAAIDESATKCDWVDDMKERGIQNTLIIEGGDRAELLRMIASLAAYRQELSEKRRKLYASDERSFTAASKLITEEFAFVLGISRDEVPGYIAERLGQS